MAVSLYCPHCRKHTALSVAKTTVGGYDGVVQADAEWEMTAQYKWWIGICNACQQPSLVLNDGEIIYPSPAPAPTDPHIPDEIARDLDEAKMCFAIQCYRACAVMARRCIQSACIAKGAKGHDLVHQIEELTKLGVITKDIQEWATVVRWVGNDAAHTNKGEVKAEDAEDCLKLAEQFLHVIFVTSAVAKARRQKRGK